MSARRSKRPRRKAKQDRARETVGVVLEAAARVLARHGYAGATTNRIAEAAGVSVGTVYEYFANKEAVFEALVEREMEELLAALQGDEPPPPDAAIGDVLGRVIVSGMTALRHGPELYRALERVPGAVAALHRDAAAGDGEVLPGVAPVVRGAHVRVLDHLREAGIRLAYPHREIRQVDAAGDGGDPSV